MASKTPLIVTLCVAAFIIIIAIAAIFIRSYAISKAVLIIQEKIAPMQLTFSAEPENIFTGPACLSSATLSGTDAIRLNAESVCLQNGLLSLLSDSPDISIDCRSVTGSVNPKKLKTILTTPSTHQTQDPNALITRSKIRHISASLIVQNYNITIGTPEQKLTWKGSQSTLNLKNGELSMHSTSTPSVALKKSIFAVRNMPELTLDANASIINHTASIQLTAAPKIELAAYYNQNLIECSVQNISIDIAQNQSHFKAHSILVSSPQLSSISHADIQEISADFSSLVPSSKNIKNIKFYSPSLKINLSKLITSDIFKQNPIFSSLLSFWQQDAGAYLGQAPMNSVRKADIQKHKQEDKKNQTGKNPISRETLETVRVFFDRIQKKIRSLPAIDIQNGSIELSSSNARYELNAISFNTAELIKDTQKFELELNVRDASAQFVVAYDNNSIYPDLSFDVQKLSSEDFLHIINLPIPDKNDGTISISMNASMTDDDFKLAGNIAFAEFAFFHEKISPNLVQHINASANFDAVYTFAKDDLKISNLTLQSGPISINGFVNISALRSAPLIEFELGATDIPCSDIPKAIPSGFLPTITRLELTGTTLSPRISGKIPWKYPLTSTLKESGFENRCFPLAVEPHSPETLNDEHYTFTTDYTYFTDSITVGPGTKVFTPLDKIPPYVKAAMFLTEDKRFFDHGPVRIAFIERALRLNLNQRKYVYGGSTISQQLAKNLFLNRSKNLARKLEEAFIAWRMESIVTKSRIFELYLNVIEFGPDVYGIHNAAKFYFDKTPEDLTPLEGAYLASLKISPSKGGRFYKFGFAQNGKWWHKRLRYILKVLSENGYISPLEAISAYNWTPEFYYPTSPSDYRQTWLRQYGEYIRRGKVQKESEEKEENERIKNAL